MRRVDLKRESFPDAVLLRRYGGGAVYTAERSDRWYVITDEGTLGGVGAELGDLEGVHEFGSAVERVGYCRERGWIFHGERFDSVEPFLQVASLSGLSLRAEDVKVEDILGAGHHPGTWRPEGQAVYSFFVGDVCLKVGKAGKKSPPRFLSHHYHTSARSALAKSILDCCETLVARLPTEMEDEVRALTAETVGAWIRKYTLRRNVFIPTAQSDLALSLLEVFLQCRFKPVFEGESGGFDGAGSVADEEVAGCRGRSEEEGESEGTRKKAERPLSQLNAHSERPLFDRYIGIDYSGAQTPTAGLRGLRVYQAGRGSEPVEIPPPSSSKKHWTRQRIAEWLVKRLGEEHRTLVGIDHGFSFPMAYFEKHQLRLDWTEFLDDFQVHWPTGEERTWVRDVRSGASGNGAARDGDPRWRRVTELRAGAAKSVFHFGVEGSVAHSTHAGLPWLRYIRREVGAKVHFWPFDGWMIPADRSAIVEVYPRLWKHLGAQPNVTGDQNDACAVAQWMRLTDSQGKLGRYFEPVLSLADRTKAEVEGWILGVE